MALCRMNSLEAQGGKWLSPGSGSSSSVLQPDSRITRTRRTLDQSAGLCASQGLDRSAGLDASTAQAQDSAAAGNALYASAGNGVKGGLVQNNMVGVYPCPCTSDAHKRPLCKRSTCILHVMLHRFPAISCAMVMITSAAAVFGPAGDCMAPDGSCVHCRCLTARPDLTWAGQEAHSSRPAPPGSGQRRAARRAASPGTGESHGSSSSSTGRRSHSRSARRPRGMAAPL